MNYLLDTHTLIWFMNGNENLSKLAQNTIEDIDSTNYVSIISIWEMAIKVSQDRLELKNPFNNIISDLQKNNFILLDIEIRDTLKLTTIPFIHKDPFDRLLISQAINNDFTLISKDEYFKDYSVKLLW